MVVGMTALFRIRWTRKTCGRTRDEPSRYRESRHQLTLLEPKRYFRSNDEGITSDIEEGRCPSYGSGEEHGLKRCARAPSARVSSRTGPESPPEPPRGSESGDFAPCPPLWNAWYWRGWLIGTRTGEMPYCSGSEC